MATIQEQKTQDGKTTYRVQVRLKGSLAQQAESAIREGQHFKTTESKKHTLG